MRRRLQSPPPDAGEAELYTRSEDSSGGGDVKCRAAISCKPKQDSGYR